MIRKKPMNRVGKRTQEWERVRRKLKVKFEAAGITTCEFEFQECWWNQALGFAHTDKRRYIGVNEMEEVALACNPCHAILELLPREQMKTEILSVIRNRERQP